MRNLKSLVLLALLFSLSLAVFADTSNDATHAKDEVKPSEATDAIEPQQRGRVGCRYGCCGSYAFGRCSACCSQAQAVEDETETEANVVEPQQRGRVGCRYGCCGSYAFGRCSACCSLSQAQTKAQAEAQVVQPQQRGCRYGCCGAYAYGQCAACCPRKMTREDEKKEDAKP